MNGHQRPKVDWTDDKKFEKDGLCVVVRKLPLRWPRYALIVGVRSEIGVGRFIPVRAFGKGKIELERVTPTLVELLTEAEDYAQSELQLIEDERIEERQRYETRDMNRGKPRAVVGLSGGPHSGKTAKRRAAKQRRVEGV